MNPAISIVIPTRNRVKLLAEALVSVRRQSFSDWELLVVDDGSTDDTRALVEGLAAEEPRIRYLERRKGNPGGNDCRNLGVEAARGGYVVFLDSDDALDLRALDERYAVMEERPDLDFGIFECTVFHQTPGDSETPHSAASQEDDISRFLKNDIPWQTASPMWRRAALRRLGPWHPDHSACQDWAYHLRALLAGLTYERFPGLGRCYWRRHDANIGSKYGQAWYVRSFALTALEVLVASDGGQRLTAQQRDLLTHRLLHAALRCGTARQAHLGRCVLRNTRAAGLIGAWKAVVLLLALHVARIKRYLPGGRGSWWHKQRASRPAPA